MSDHQYTIEELDQLGNHLAEVVGRKMDIKFNGKMDKFLTDWEKHKQEDREWKEKINMYVKDDYAWKVKAQPAIDMGNNTKNFGKISLWLFGFVIALGGAITIVKGWVK